jgi:thiamine-phosphate pyrophosphorylase
VSRDGQWRRARLAAARLYLCTDRRAGQGDLAAFLDATLGAGVDLVQLRDKEAGAREQADAAEHFRAAAARHDALFIMNDDPALAVAADADGVHVGQDDLPPAAARDVVGPERLIGRSTHDPAQFDRGLDEDVDYLALGPVHATPTKEGRRPIGLAPIAHAAEVAGARPWFVTGAMSTATAPAVLDAGAQGIVVVRAITEAADPAAAVRELVALLGRDPTR